MKLRGILTLWLAFVMGATGQQHATQAPAGSSTLDPALEQMLALRTDPLRAHLAPRMNAPASFGASPAAEDTVGVLIAGDGRVEAAVLGAGGRVGSRHGSIRTAVVPVDALRMLSVQPGIRAIEGARTLRPSLNRSVPSTGAHVLHAQTDVTRRLTGKGVIIGFTDSGIHTPHPSFRTIDGRTRILSVWDQQGSGNPPPGWSYGAEHDSSDINSRRWWMYDLAEHGTHVAGIAAGNGRTGGTFIGMAPEADIIMVCNRPDDLWSGGLTTVGTLDGYDYIRAKATALGKRHVINTSQGTNLGPHDGTSLFEQAIDADVRAGSVLCLAAGNEGSSARHASAVIPPGGAVEIRCAFHTVFPNDSAAIPMEAWYSGGDRISISCRKESDASFPPSVVPGGTAFLSFDSLDVAVTSMVHSPLNGDNVIRCSLLPAVPVTVSDIVLVFRLEAAGDGALPEGGRIDLWWERNFEVAFLDHRDETCTIGMPGGADGAITVGSCDNDDTGALSVFSAHGPARDGAWKPDIVAPGGNVTSTVPGSNFRGMSGTSMAAPHVAGAAALLLENDPTLTPAQVKERLLGAARSDAGTGQVPNALWGHGRLDVWRALYGDLPQPQPPAVVAVRQSGADAVIQWNDPPADPVRALRCVLVTRDGICIDSVAPGIGIFTDRMPGVGKHTYILTATWSDGWRSAPAGPASVEVFLAGNPWLLVDDDAGMPFESYFMDALAAAGGSCDVWHTIAVGAVTPEVLAQYLRGDGGVIWFCGSDYTSPLTSAEQLALAAFLDAGGRLFITGQDIGYALTVRGGESDRHFYATYLRAELALDGSGVFALGGTDAGFLRHSHYRIGGGDGADDQVFPSAVVPLPPAVPLMQYDDVVPDPELAARSQRVDPFRPVMHVITGTPLIGALAYTLDARRVVYFSFGFEAIDSVAMRAEVMRRIVRYLTAADTLCTGFVRRPGWSMRSVPVHAASMRAGDLFSFPAPLAMGYDGALRAADTLTCGRGYWCNDVVQRTEQMCGDTAAVHDIPLQAGWNLIAPFHVPVHVDGITTTPPGIIASRFYGFTVRFTPADILLPTEAYWVKAAQDGILHCGR